MVELQLRALLASLGVHVDQSQLAEAFDLLEAGEWLVGFEWLCDSLYEFETPILPGERAAFEAIGEQVAGLSGDLGDRGTWRLMRELEIEP